MTHYDLFVIGGGSGGVAAARSSAALGAKVGIAEGDKFGGTCVNRGCMPKKWYMYASTYMQEFETAKSYGWDIGETSFHWQTLKDRTFKEIARLNGIYDTMLNNAGVIIHNGFARFRDSKTVIINNEEITADKFIVAPGGKPFMPDIEGIEYGISSDEAFHLEELPESIIIVGGGYIGVEFACIFNGLGVDTTIMYRADQMLRGFDHDVRRHAHKEFEKKGIKTVPTTAPTRMDKQDNGKIHVICNHGKDWCADQVMFATGRVPNLEHTNIEATGIQVDESGKVIVDEWQKTNVDHIYALGDVTNTNYDLTPVAINEGRAFADTHFGGKKRNFSEFVTPTAVFSQPQIGTVGLTEEQARSQYNNVDIYRTAFGPTKYKLSETVNEELMLKLIVDADTDLVVGAHMVGPEAGEVIQIMGVALKAGATKHDFDRTVGVHPTFAEELVTMREKISDDDQAVD